MTEPKPASSASRAKVSRFVGWNCSNIAAYPRVPTVVFLLADRCYEATSFSDGQAALSARRPVAIAARPFRESRLRVPPRAHAPARYSRRQAPGDTAWTMAQAVRPSPAMRAPDHTRGAP